MRIWTIKCCTFCKEKPHEYRFLLISLAMSVHLIHHLSIWVHIPKEEDINSPMIIVYGHIQGHKDFYFTNSLRPLKCTLIRPIINWDEYVTTDCSSHSFISTYWAYVTMIMNKNNSKMGQILHYIHENSIAFHVS